MIRLKKESLPLIVFCLLVSIFAVVGIIRATTTTIGANISTGGTLTVSGAVYATSTLLLDGAATFKDTVTLSAANLKVSTGYGLDTAAASGVLNIGTTSATTIKIGSTGGTTVIRGNLTIPSAYSLDANGVLNIGTTTATTINIGSTGAVTAIKGNLTIPGSYSLDAAGVLNIGTTTATAITIGKLGITTNFPGLATLANASSTLANFGGGTTVSGLLFGTCAVDPQSITAATSSVVSTSCNTSNSSLTSSYQVFVTPPSDTISDDNWLVFGGASASSTAGYIEITLFNASTTVSVDGPSRTWSWMAIK